MKASPIMLFDYLAMIGVPILLGLLAAAALFGAGRLVQIILLALIAAGCTIYFAIGLREAYVHGGKKRASTDR